MTTVWPFVIPLRNDAILAALPGLPLGANRVGAHQPAVLHEREHDLGIRGRIAGDVAREGVHVFDDQRPARTPFHAADRSTSHAADIAVIRHRSDIMCAMTFTRIATVVCATLAVIALTATLTGGWYYGSLLWRFGSVAAFNSPATAGGAFSAKPSMILEANLSWAA